MGTRSTIDINLRERRCNGHVAPAPGCLDETASLCKARNNLCGSISRGAAMTTFDKREEAFEQQFAHDEELRFKATARRNKMLGLWAAEKLGLSGASADSYALSVVMSAFEDTDAHDVMRKIRKDFDAKGVAQSDHQIARQMTELMAKAIEDVKAGR
jgi:hypothetical protein